MLISTKTSVYSITEIMGKPELVLDNVDVRRIAETNNKYIIVLADGSIIIKDGEKDKIMQTGITDRIDCILALEEDPLELLLGCTPPNLYKFTEGKGLAKPVAKFQSLAVRDEWFTPWGGPPAVRSMGMTNDGWIYADIHVGSIMRSSDKGETWEPVKPGLHRDVHQVVTCPINNDRVYANTYLSVYVSEDRGDTWYHRSGALSDRYGRGIAVNPMDPDVLLCGVSDGPIGENVHGQLYWSGDAGVNWVHIVDGFPGSTRNNIDTFHIQFDGEHAWVSDENRLYNSQDRGRTWSLYWSAPEEIIMFDTGDGCISRT